MSTTGPVKVEHPYVQCHAHVQGGRPVINGTRFPVSSIVQNYLRGRSIEDILREFPHLNAAQVHDALSYYHDHQPEMDAQIADLADIAQAIRRHPPTKRPADDNG